MTKKFAKYDLRMAAEFESLVNSKQREKELSRNQAKNNKIGSIAMHISQSKDRSSHAPERLNLGWRARFRK
jgi:hypothetical protein